MPILKLISCFLKIWPFPGLFLVFLFDFNHPHSCKKHWHENEKQQQWFYSRQQTAFFASLPPYPYGNRKHSFTINLIYQCSTKSFFHFLATLYSTWKFIVFENCTEKTRPTRGWILLPPDNLLIGFKWVGSGCCFSAFWSVILPLNGRHWPPGLVAATILPIATNSKLIWSV